MHKNREIRARRSTWRNGPRIRPREELRRWQKRRPARSHSPQVRKPQGIVATGVVQGAMVETDCARVSIGDKASRRKP